MSIPSNSLRALIVTNMWPTSADPESGIFVADQVAALRRAGVDLEVFAFPGGGLAAYARATARLARMRQGRFDVVHAHFGLSAWVAMAAPARVRAVTFHGTDLHHPRSRRISLAALGRVDLVAAVSEDLASEIPAGRVPSGVKILPCGIATDRFAPGDRAEARRQLGISQTARVLLLPSDPGRPEKRADRARELARATGSELLTLGSVRPDDVATRINAADAVVIPSEREGFGLALLEALACARPVLSTPNGIAPTALAGMDGALCAEWNLDVWASTVDRIIAERPVPDASQPIAEWSADACASRVIDAWQSELDRA